MRSESGLIVALAMTALTACATTPTVYTHATKTRADFSADLTACNREALDRVGNPAATEPWAALALSVSTRQQRTSVFYQCMTLRGWQGPGRQSVSGKVAYGSEA